MLKIFVFSGCILGKRHFSTSKPIYTDSDDGSIEYDSTSSLVLVLNVQIT